jgi:uncharacterized membrane protein YccC
VGGDARYDGRMMRWSLTQWRAWLDSGPNRIALSTAARGTIATVAPLPLLPLIGLDDFAYPAVLGALATSMVDVAGPYGSRLAAMLVQGLGGPFLLLLASALVTSPIAAGLVMVAVGLGCGMVRALGPGGVSLGVNMGVVFLVGLQIGEVPGLAPQWVIGYAGGGVWTIAVAFAFWQLRPFRRLEQEVASAWQTVARLVAAVETEAAAGTTEAEREKRIAAAHAAVRDVIERTRESLGDMRAGIAGPGTTIAQLTVLLNAAARVAAAALTLGEVTALPGSSRRAAEAELERACRDVARILLSGGDGLPLVPPRRPLPQGGAPPRQADLLAWAQILRHFDNANEALRLLFSQPRRLGDLLRLPFAHRRPPGAAFSALRANLSMRSAIFRHALRVAVVTGIDAAMVVRFRLPHGIWLPLTSLVILQPDYAGTLARALQRSAGTIAGAALAGALLVYVHSGGYDTAIGLLVFATFLLIRRRYGYAITFLTPLIILLIGMSSANPWIDLVERVAYTVAGTVLALAAGYLLWPQWEREQLRDRLARAIRADRAYLVATLAALARPEPSGPELAALQREAELAVANADAGFQRMLSEPARRHAPVAVGFSLLTYGHRLCRHTIALAAQLGAVTVPPEPLAELRPLVEAALEDVAQAVSDHRPPAPRPAFDLPLARLSEALSAEGAEGAGATAAALLGRTISDITGLMTALSTPGLVSSG